MHFNTRPASFCWVFTDSKCFGCTKAVRAKTSTFGLEVYGGWARSDTAKNVNPDDCATDPVKCGGCSQELQGPHGFYTSIIAP